MRNSLAFSLLTLVFAVLTASVANAKEERVPLDKVPTAVLDAIQAKFPGAKLAEAEKETEDGKTTSHRLPLCWQVFRSPCTWPPPSILIGKRRSDLRQPYGA